MGAASLIVNVARVRTLDVSCATTEPAPSANTIPTSANHFSARQLPLAKIAPVRMSQSPL